MKYCQRCNLVDLSDKDNCPNCCRETMKIPECKNCGEYILPHQSYCSYCFIPIKNAVDWQVVDSGYFHFTE